MPDGKRSCQKSKFVAERGITVEYSSNVGQWKEEKRLRYLYQGNDEVGSVDRNGDLLDFRVLRPGRNKRAVILESKGKAYAPIYDHNGSMAALIERDQSGTLVESYR